MEFYNRCKIAYLFICHIHPFPASLRLSMMSVVPDRTNGNPGHGPYGATQPPPQAPHTPLHKAAALPATGSTDAAAPDTTLAPAAPAAAAAMRSFHMLISLSHS
jgi:hypothetical protein